MTQSATVITRNGTIGVELPDPWAEVMSGVPWGEIGAFPTPAYFAYQVIARRLTNQTATYRLGRSLAQEVGACLLGGHGIPAPVGLAAYNKLLEEGVFEGPAPSAERLETLLKQPVTMGSKSVHYRFAAQKAKYLAEALKKIPSAPKTTVGKQLRDWLVELPGIGPKTASWIARNWLEADDVAILDIHILRVGQAIHLFPKSWSVDRHYSDLEALFLKFSTALDTRASELDAIIWYEMANSPQAVRHLVSHLRNPEEARRSDGLSVQTQFALR
ncbi:8-oxoguanine DNA glycosylase [Variovorax sp. RHLX14]|uniref:8-oxoguanine DNA glycosylase n=1 Tax=Variovorax sp. RHLX14 TaxID=1259731 RepID=UPI003F467E86